ncbi:MAG: hypothetical protein OXH85_01740 [Truepera sp.]|nr:hypothetical protein [Truepera sp.]
MLRAPCSLRLVCGSIAATEQHVDGAGLEAEAEVTEVSVVGFVSVG